MDSAEKGKESANAPDGSVVYKQRKGYFLECWVVGLLVVIALSITVAVGLLVGYLGPCPAYESESAALPNSSSPSEPRVTTYPYVLLPTSIIPIHYSVQLQPYLIPNNFTFDGDVQVKIHCLQPTTNVSLHINDLIIHPESIKFWDSDSSLVLNVKTTSQDELRQFYILHLDKSLKRHSNYTVSMKFRGNLNDDLAGFYRSSYTDTSGKQHWLATTQFQPTDARRAFPCFDEPGLKSTFNITLIRWKNMTSLSNMPKLRTEPRGDEWEADIYSKTVKMSTYLLAFILSDFSMKSTPGGEFRVWARPSVLDTADYALEIGPKILQFFQDYFGITYPLPKTDMIALPDFNAGAMENWGLITYRESTMLFDHDVSSASNKQRVATVVSHELAHQWFGNLVTPKWWDDLWLNEGFASYVEYLGVKSVEKAWNMDQQFVLDEVQDVMELDSLKTSHPISVPVHHPDEINEIFDRISYGKGASIIRMMNHYLGEHNFRKGLTSYLRTKAYGNAVQDDLWWHLTKVQEVTREEDRIKVKEVMDSWTLQTGYPVLTVSRDYEAGTAEVAQNRFLLEKEEPKDVSGEPLWKIPVTYTDSRNPDWENTTTKLWLHSATGTMRDLPGPNDWLIVNIQEVGYYRVNYDVHNWKLVINQLEKDHEIIHVVNRAQLMDDAMDLARAGLLPYDLALKTTLYIHKERDYLPWDAALESLSYIDMMLSRSAIYGKWEKYVLRQLSSMYNELGWEEDESESILIQYNRINSLGWTCKHGHPQCVKIAKRKFQEWKDNYNDLTIIPPNLRSVVYCTAIQYGGQEAWDFTWERYLEEEVASERDKLMRALACAREPWLLSRYLEWSLNQSSGIKRQDGTYVFRSVASNIYGRDIAFNYLRDKWDTLLEIYGKSFFSLGSLVQTVTSSLNTPFELDQLVKFYENHKDKLGTAHRSFKQAIEKARANVQWMKDNFEIIANWLDNISL